MQRRYLDLATGKQYRMQDADFEWDDDKAARNLVRHGVSFELARLVFSDPWGVGEVDDREEYGEERSA
jgi:uncharacterized DUF497 family protein